jgi:hypothetical protein
MRNNKSWGLMPHMGIAYALGIIIKVILGETKALRGGEDNKVLSFPQNAG